MKDKKLETEEKPKKEDKIAPKLEDIIFAPKIVFIANTHNFVDQVT